MKLSHHLPFQGLLLFSLISSQLCKICEISKEQYFYLNPLVSTIINSKYTNGVQAANILLSLRLTGINNQRLDQQFIQQINVARKGSHLTSGQLSLFTLALGACKNPNTSFSFDPHLIDELEKKFQAEIENMEAHEGNPLTNYYQFSTTVLTLCLFNGKYPITKVSHLLMPDNKNYYFGGQFSVDTGAMAVLALSCMKESIVNQKIQTDVEVIVNNIQQLVQKILAEKKENGLIGNIFSTGEAMQALFVSSSDYDEHENVWNCSQTLDTILKEVSQGAFSLPIAAAQVLPALLGKTYLDVNKDSSCVYNSDKFNISIHQPIPGMPTNESSNITVHYSVKINETYPTTVTVKNGSVFLDVMEEAQKQNETLFRFTVAESAWGPYVTSVQGLEANNNDRSYWQLLSEDKPLSQGVASYVVHDGDYLEVKWSKY